MKIFISWFAIKHQELSKSSDSWKRQTVHVETTWQENGRVPDVRGQLRTGLKSSRSWIDLMWAWRKNRWWIEESLAVNDLRFFEICDDVETGSDDVETRFIEDLLWRTEVLGENSFKIDRMTPTDQRIRSRIQGFRRGSKRVKDSTTAMGDISVLCLI